MITDSTHGLGDAPRGLHTSYDGSQVSIAMHSSGLGQVVGIARRYGATDDPTAQDAWYFDPALGMTFPVVGSVRLSDQFAFALPSVLAENGVLLGSFDFFLNGVGEAERRAFAFRPDLGFVDLGALVQGGLSESGWSTLREPLYADALRTIVGYGLVEGQTSGQSIFVMVPGPAGTAMFLISLLTAPRRRRS